MKIIQEKTLAGQAKGFLLIEFLVYLALFSLLALLVATFLVQSYALLQKHAIIAERTLRLHLASDLLRRDMEKASSATIDWDCQRNVAKVHYIDFQGRLRFLCIGWLLKKGRLMRSEGVYDFVHNRWQQQVQSVVADKVTLLRFHYQKDETLENITRLVIECAAESVSSIRMTIPLSLRST